MRQNSHQSLSLIPLPTGIPDTAAVKLTEPSHNRAVKRVIEEMSDHLDESLSLKEMSHIAYISPYHFNRIFRDVTGIPPCQFLWALRLEAAKRLLLTTSISVTDVCFEVGYNSLGTFTRRFTGLTGLSPGRFRALPYSGLMSALSLMQDEDAMAHTAVKQSLSGTVSASPDFNGLIFIGLFKTPIPQGEPLVGTVRQGPGRFQLAAIPDGHYYLLGAGLPLSTDPTQLFLNDKALRGGQHIHLRDGMRYSQVHLRLRPPGPFDPPILSTLPWLFLKQKASLSAYDQKI
jgi:AraC family transcriptional regulator